MLVGERFKGMTSIMRGDGYANNLVIPEIVDASKLMDIEINFPEFVKGETNARYGSLSFVDGEIQYILSDNLTIYEGSLVTVAFILVDDGFLVELAKDTEDFLYTRGADGKLVGTNCHGNLKAGEEYSENGKPRNSWSISADGLHKTVAKYLKFNKSIPKEKQVNMAKMNLALIATLSFRDGVFVIHFDADGAVDISDYQHELIDYAEAAFQDDYDDSLFEDVEDPEDDDDVEDDTESDDDCYFGEPDEDEAEEE